MTINGKALTRRVLIVDDEMLIALHLESILEELEHEVVGLAVRMDRGMALARQNGVDFAVLDINIAGNQSFPIADILRDRGIPFIFSTAYGTDHVADGYANVIILRKPFQSQALQRAITRAVENQA